MRRSFSKALRGATGAALLAGSAGAADLGTVGGFDVRWDTSVRLSLGLRTEPADSALLAVVNGDDGDRAFTPGLISDRLDLLSQLQISRDDAGLYVSGDGWYDGAYHGRTANTSPATFNPITVPYTQFPQATRHLDGGMAELLDAYAYARFDQLSLRIGRQTLLWGESFFFPENAIAGAQSPVDGIKALGQPLAQNREILLPVAQASVRLGLPNGFSAEAYAQFEWRRDRLPGVGSYFSTVDYLDAGGERLFAGNPATGGFAGGGPVPGDGYQAAAIHASPAAAEPPTLPAFTRGADRVPPDLGQFGAALRYANGDWDAGLYALRFAAKLPTLYYAVAPAASGYGNLYRYGLDFPRFIALYGASLSRSWQQINIAGEISARVGMPLLSGTPPLLPPAAAARFATGTTLHANLSADAVLPPSRFWQGAEWLAEIAADDVASVTGEPAALLPGRTRAAMALRTSFTPNYFEVLPNLDISLPLGLGIGLAGRSRIDSALSAGIGDVEAGVQLTYRRRWQGALSFTHFIGGALADRDFVILSVSRTF